MLHHIFKELALDAGIMKVKWAKTRILQNTLVELLQKQMFRLDLAVDEAIINLYGWPYFHPLVCCDDELFEPPNRFERKSGRSSEDVFEIRLMAGAESSRANEIDKGGGLERCGKLVECARRHQAVVYERQLEFLSDVPACAKPKENPDVLVGIRMASFEGKGVIELEAKLPVFGPLCHCGPYLYNGVFERATGDDPGSLQGICNHNLQCLLTFLWGWHG